MRILAITIYYPPEHGANARVVAEMAAEWTRLGHEVTVLADVPHYPDDVVPERYRKGRNRDEIMDGIRVIRNPLIIRNRASSLWRLANNVSYALSIVRGAMKAGKIDAIYVYSPPIFLGIGAWMIKWLKRAPLIFNVQDIYPDVAISHGFLKNKFLIWGFQRFEKWVYNRSTRITLISDGFRENLLAKGVRADKIDVIRSFADVDRFAPGPKNNAFRRAQGLSDKFVVHYGGNFGHMHGMATVIEAARLLEHDRPDVAFVLVGGGVEDEAIRELHQQYGLKNLRILRPFPYAEVPGILHAADASLVLLKPGKEKDWIQGKTYEIMAAERPLIACMDSDNDNWKLVERAGGGMNAKAGDPEDLANVIRRLADDPELCRRLGKAGREYVLKYHTLNRCATDYLAGMNRARGEDGVAGSECNEGPES